MSEHMLKDPNANLDFSFGWANWLETLETITTYELTVPAGLVKGLDSKADKMVIVWLSGGTAGTTYNVTCKITTSLGRVDERTIHIQIQDR